MLYRADHEAAQQVTQLQDALAVLQQGLEAKQLRRIKINASLQALSVTLDGAHNPEQSLAEAQPITGSAGMQCMPCMLCQQVHLAFTGHQKFCSKASVSSTRG